MSMPRTLKSGWGMAPSPHFDITADNNVLMYSIVTPFSRPPARKAAYIPLTGNIFVRRCCTSTQENLFDNKSISETQAFGLTFFHVDDVNQRHR